ncbi:MAG: TonB family protein, partial [bacterium]
KDFVVKYKLAGDLINSGLLLSKGEGKDAENFFLLTVQPPKRIDPAYIPPREYVFVLDVSGSMNGFPSVMAKKTILNLLDKLDKDDKFNLILFASGFDVFSENLVTANRDNLEKAFKFMAESRQGGGTELLPALEKALTMPKDSKASRSVVVITDGLIDFEAKAFELIRNNLNKANVFAFGIGTSMNKLTIEGIARAGNGLYFEANRLDDAEYQSERFVKYIATPILTDIKVTYDGFGVSEVEPMSVPDLFPDRPIIIYGKWDGNLQGGIKIEAINGQEKISVELPVTKFGEMVQGDALKQLWARKQIELLSDYQNFGVRDKYKKEITDLGLKYSLMTAYTSFIAVDNEIVPNIDKQMNNGSSQGFEIRNSRSEDTQVKVDGQSVSNQFTGGLGTAGSGGADFKLQRGQRIRQIGNEISRASVAGEDAASSGGNKESEEISSENKSGQNNPVGEPVPAPDSEITPEMKDFSSVDEVVRASSIGGEGNNAGGFSENIDLGNEISINKDIVSIPDLGSFVAVEEAPKIADYGALTKSVVYPEIAKRAGIEGKVIVAVYIDKYGKPRKTKITNSPNAILDQAAIDAVMKYTGYVPAIQNKQPVGCWLQVPINFGLKNSKNPDIDLQNPQIAETAHIQSDTDNKQPQLTNIRYNQSILENNIKYAYMAKAITIEGLVEMRITIDAKGKITKIEPLGQANTLLDDIAIVAINNTQFIPANLDGENIVSTIDVKMNIQPQKPNLNFKFEGQSYEMIDIKTKATEYSVANLKNGTGKNIVIFDKVKFECSIYNDKQELIKTDTITVTVGIGETAKPIDEVLVGMQAGGEKLLVFPRYYLFDCLYPTTAKTPYIHKLLFKIKVFDINPK